MCLRAVRPDEHGAVGLRPGDVRAHRGDVPSEPPPPRRRPAPRGRLARARAMMPARRPGRILSQLSTSTTTSTHKY